MQKAGVSILVVMDVALAASVLHTSETKNLVSILVVMDVALAESLLSLKEQIY